MGMTDLAYLTGTSYGDVSVEGECQWREKSVVVLPHPLSLHMTLVIKFHTGGGSEKKPMRCVCVCTCVCVCVCVCVSKWLPSFEQSSQDLIFPSVLQQESLPNSST